ncbi:MAG: hypothetical protein WCF94_02750 [bacterium]
MKSIKEIIGESVSSYTGSEATKAMVMEEIKKRYGESELKNFDPYHNARTLHSWAKLGFRVRKGERAIKSMTFIESKDENGNPIKRCRRPVNIFYYRQVDFIGPEQTI